MNFPDWEPVAHEVYKYRLRHAFNHALEHFEPLNKYRARIVSDDWIWVELYGDGLLHLGRGYCWDGASGPALDTMNIARASLVHDALYQLIAHGELPMKPWKRHADREFYRLMRADGVSWWRAAYAFAAVRLFGRGRDRFKPDGLRPGRRDAHQ